MNNIFLGYPPENVKQWIIDHSGPDLTIPLCFEAVDAGATIALKCNGNKLKTATFQSSTDGQNWSDYTYRTNITLANAGDKVYFKAKDDNTSIKRNYSDYLQFTTAQPTKKVKVSGNVMSLLAPEFGQMKSVRSYCFYNLFCNCENISDCSSMTLPATTLADYCYSGMFNSCTSLTQAPELPATTLANICYNNMFNGCTSLTQAPELPATTLANSCYNCMFQNCTSLTQAPELPATTLADNCYGSMFSGCSSLAQAPELPATTLAYRCYSDMFNSCTSLTQAPELPATTLADYCYIGMFNSCTSLTQAPAIKTYTPELSAFDGMLGMFDYYASVWGQLTSCNWPDLTLSEAESMVLNEHIFGYSDDSETARISITCKDGPGTAYYDSGKSSWVFEH